MLSSYHDLWVATWSSLWCPLWLQFPPHWSLNQPSLCCLSTPSLLSPVGLSTWCPLCLNCSSNCCWCLDHILLGPHISVHTARILPASSCSSSSGYSLWWESSLPLQMASQKGQRSLASENSAPLMRWELVDQYPSSPPQPLGGKEIYRHVLYTGSQSSSCRIRLHLPILVTGLMTYPLEAVAHSLFCFSILLPGLPWVTS